MMFTLIGTFKFSQLDMNQESIFINVDFVISELLVHPLATFIATHIPVCKITLSCVYRFFLFKDRTISHILAASPPHGYSNTCT